MHDIEFLGFMVKWFSRRIKEVRGIEGGEADGFLILLGFDLLQWLDMHFPFKEGLFDDNLGIFTFIFII